MRTIWKVLTVAVLILVGCKGDKNATEAPRPTQAGMPPEPTRPLASDQYFVKFKLLLDVGQTVAVHQTVKQAGGMKTYQGGTWTQEKREEARESDFKQTLLEAGDKLPRKFKRHYEKASRTIQGETISLVYEGKTILFELAGDRYKATAPDGGLGPIPLGVLAQDVSTEVHLERALVPGKPVRLHETWPINPNRLQEIFGGMEGIIPAKSKGEATLAKVYQNQGKQFGVIDFQITLAIGELQKSRVDPPLTRTWTGSVDAAIDGSSTSLNSSWTSKLTGKAQMEGADKKKSLVEATMESTGHREQSNVLTERK